MSATNAQSYQDEFALRVCGPSGTYLEIGAHHPRKYSNTLRLEQQGWRGMGVELDTQYADAWQRDRSNPVYWADALTFDYASALRDAGLNTHVSYLSCDIEPAHNTFAALQRVIAQGLTFDCITFEHDGYRYRGANYHELATVFLAEHGYKIAVQDVFWKRPAQMYETWYVRQSMPFLPITYAAWIRTL